MARKRCCATPKPAASLLPAWADAGLTVAGSTIRYTFVTFDGSTEPTLAKADPRRWAIGFSNGASVASTALVWPRPGTRAGAFGFGAGVPFLWYTAFEHGPLVALEWVGFGQPFAGMGIWEVYNLNRR